MHVCVSGERLWGMEVAEEKGLVWKGRSLLGTHLSLGPSFSAFTGSGPRPRGGVSVGRERLNHPDHSPLPTPSQPQVLSAASPCPLLGQDPFYQTVVHSPLSSRDINGLRTT